MEKQVNNDEIDLVELLVKVVLLVKSNFLQILIFFIVGTGLGYAYASLAPKVYESKMIISSGILTESYSKWLIETLNSLVKERNTELVSSKLGISKEEANDLGKFEIEPINSKATTSPDKDNSSFLISVELSNEGLLPKLEKGLVNYLQDNDYVKIRVEQSKNYLKQMIDKVQAEIESLESFKSSIYEGKFFQRTNGNIMFDPTTVNSKILDLTKEKINLENSLELVNSVQVIEGFTKFDKPVWPKKSVSLAAGATLGLFLVGIIIAFKAVRKLVRFAEAHPVSKEIQN